MANYKKRFERDTISGTSQDIIDKTDKNLKIDASGIAGDILMEPIPQYISTQSEIVYNNKNNSWIVLGRDRNASRLSGYGGKGHTQAASIDIVVGRMANEVQSIDPITQEQIWVDPDFEKDAARIYVSQKADIDEYFKIDGTMPSNTRSAIGMKADQIRIIGREKIKLITGTDIKNSQGGEINQIEGIEIIAGNDVSDIQPIPKGDNLQKALEQLTDLVDSLSGIVDSLTMTLFEFNKVVSTHFHISPFFSIPTTPSETLIPAGQKHALDMLTKVKRSILNFKINLGSYKITYLNQIGDRYINSRKNKVN